MSCSKARRLPALLRAALRELRRAVNSRAAPPGPGPRAGADGSLYIRHSMIFYGCLGGALSLAHTRSRKLESKHDPYHPYIERDWGPVGPAQQAEEGAPPRGRAPMRERDRRSELGNMKGPSCDGSASAALPPGDCGQRATAWMRNCSDLVQWLVQCPRLVMRQELFFNSLDSSVLFLDDKYLHYILRPFSI